MIRAIGIIGLVVTAQPVTANEPVCPPIGLIFEQEGAQQVLRIVPTCLGGPEDIGIAMAEVTRIVLDAHQTAFPNRSYVAVEEVLVESYVSEILEPTVSAPAN